MMIVRFINLVFREIFMSHGEFSIRFLCSDVLFLANIILNHDFYVIFNIMRFDIMVIKNFESFAVYFI